MFGIILGTFWWIALSGCNWIQNLTCGIIIGTISCILLKECNFIQDLHGWYHPWNYFMDSVSWVQLNTGLTCLVSSLELFH
jgi:hypothetical protein